MIKGFLKLNVLTELKSSSKTGYELMQSLEKKIGKKPSPGSIYPLLNDLVSSGYVTSREEGRKKIYSLTCKGRYAVKKLLKEKQKTTLKHIESLRSIGKIIGEKEVEPLIRLTDMLSKQEKPALRFIAIMSELRDIIIDLASHEDYPEKEIKKIISSASKQLKKLRNKQSKQKSERSYKKLY